MRSNTAERLRPVRRWAWSALAVAAGLAWTTAQAAAQSGVITGKVTDTRRGEALTNVYVQVEGTSRAAHTRADGTFRISGLREGSYGLRASRLGFLTATQTVTVGAEPAAVELRLAPSAVELDELVVTGQAAATPRREIGASVVTIDGAGLDETPVFSLSQMLQSRAPGVTVFSGGGKPGQGSRVILRGVNTLTQEVQPIVYVDGIRVDNSSYSGMRFNSVFSLADPGGPSWSGLDDINPADVDRVEIIRGASATTLYGTEAAGGVIQIFTKRGAGGTQQWNVRSEVGTSSTPRSWWDVSAYGDWFYDRYVSRGTQHQQQISVRGAVDRFAYYASGSHGNENGVLAGSGEQHTSFRANASVSPTQTLRVNMSTAFSLRDVELPYDANSQWGLARNGLIGGPRGIAGAPDSLQDGAVDLRATRYTGGATLEHTPWAAFQHRLSLGLDLFNSDNSDLVPWGSPIFRTGRNTNARRQAQTTNLEYTAQLRAPLTSSVRSTTSAGFQAYQTNYVLSYAHGENFAGPGLSTVRAGSVTDASETRIETRSMGFFGEEQLALAERLFVTVGGRLDGHSSFGDEHRYQFYPKADVSYLVSEMGFWPEGAGTLRLRAAYGKAGRQPAAYLSARTWAPTRGNGNSSGLTTGNLGNPDLSPEISREFEVGADAGLWGERVRVEVSLYDQRTADALYPVLPKPSTGYLTAQLMNVGEVSNRGIEASVRANLLEGDRLGWSAHAGLFTNRNRVESIGGERDLNLGRTQWIRAGYPVGAFFGDRYVVRNGTAELVQNDYIGPAFPTRTVQLGSDLRVGRGLGFNVLVDHRGGHYVHSNTLSELAGRLAPVGDEIATPGEQVGNLCAGATDAATVAACASPATAPGNFVFAGDVWRLRELGASYSLPASLSGRLRVNRATLSVSGRNLWRSQDYPGLEAEASYDASRDLFSQTYFDTPLPRQIVAGVSLQF